MGFLCRHLFLLSHSQRPRRTRPKLPSTRWWGSPRTEVGWAANGVFEKPWISFPWVPDVGNPWRENDLPHLGIYLWGYLHISHRTGGDTSKVATEKLRKMMINHGIESTLDGLTFFKKLSIPVRWRPPENRQRNQKKWISEAFACLPASLRSDWLGPWILNVQIWGVGCHDYYFSMQLKQATTATALRCFQRFLVAAKLTGHSCWGSWWRIHNLKMDISSMYSCNMFFFLTHPHIYI